jgi:tetratricopeptide (TPR) repeat protein
MKMKMFLSLVFVSCITASSTFAQSVDNAKKMFQYERYQSAKSELEKIVAATATNADAQYWLILSNLMLGDKANARKIATAALTATNNNALVNVAAGHIELIDEKKPEARSKFETAISLSDKKTLPSILLAIGRANGMVGISQSEPEYGIEKVKQALVKDPTNGELLIALGDCYRRKLDASSAVSTYMSIAATSPQSAMASYRLGQVYKAQDNCKILTSKFTEATTKDPNYMAAWRELYDAHANDESACYDIAAARTYLDKYVATSDPGASSDKIKMTFCYYSKDYACALTEATNIANKYGEPIATEMLSWKGYIYEKQNDTLKSFNAFEQYINNQKDPTLIDFRLFKKIGDIALRIAGKDATALSYYEKYLTKTEDKKLKGSVFAKLSSYYEGVKDFKNASTWYRKLLEVKEDATAGDYYKAGIATYNASDYVNAVTVFTTYADKFPTDYRGNFYAARSSALIDTTMEQGLAAPFYEKYLPIAQLDSTKTKNGMVEASKYLFIYNLNIKKDKTTAKAYLEKLRSIDPTNSEIPSFESYLSGAVKQPAPKKVVPATTPKTGTTTTPKPGTTTVPKTGTAVVPKPKPTTVVKPVVKKG